MSEDGLSPALERLRLLNEHLVSPELFYRLLDGLPDALVVVDSSGRVVLFNSQAELLFGYHRSEVTGHEVEMLIPEAARARHANHRTAFTETPQTRPMGTGLVLAARHKDGHEVPVSINLSPIVSPDGLYTSAVIRRKPRE
ncbi:MAG TPA: PAS domain S-box protein [Solirubrobacterales bacterium]